MSIVDHDKLITDFTAVVASITLNELELLASLQAVIEQRSMELKEEHDKNNEDDNSGVETSESEGGEA